MIDAHVHLERGPYTKEWLARFVEVAKAAGVGRLDLLEHTHRFAEFGPLYEGAAAYSLSQAERLAGKMVLGLGDYLAFADAMRGIDWGLELRFGLEVCYVPEREGFLRSRLGGLGLDFLTGSVHWIDGWGFDLSRESWEGRDLDAVWERYYAIMTGLAASGLFDRLAHPDSIKVYGHRPGEHPIEAYLTLAALCASREIEVEVSAGLANNFGFPRVGIDEPLFGILREAGCRFVAASDAHRPEDVGKGLPACLALIGEGRKQLV